MTVSRGESRSVRIKRSGHSALSICSRWRLALGLISVACLCHTSLVGPSVFSFIASAAITEPILKSVNYLRQVPKFEGKTCMSVHEIAECWLIDEAGRAWGAADPALRRSLQTDVSTDQLRDFTLGKMGFVEIRRRGPRIVVTLDPKRVSSSAVVGLLYWLHDAHWVGRLALQVFGSDHDAELVPNIAAFGARLEVLSQCGRDNERTRFQCVPVSTDEVTDDCRIGTLFELWRSSAIRSRSEIAAFCARHFDGRYTLVRPLSNGEFVVDEMGRGYVCYDRSYVAKAAGTLLIDEPDYAYGMWVSEAYRSVALSRAPDFSDVAANIRSPHAADVSVQYRRLVIPFTDPEFGDYIVSASVLRHAA